MDLRVDRDAVYVIIWVREPWRGSTAKLLIWCLVDVRKPGNMVIYANEG